VRVCYVDEAGCTGALPGPTSNVQPIFILCGVDVRAADVSPLTRDFLYLKRRFFPGICPPEAVYLSSILPEIKGADIRRQAVSSSRRQSRQALGFLDAVVKLLEKYEARLHGRIWIKGIGLPFNGRSVYTFSLQYICQWFDHCLGADDTTGVVICDSRNKALNSIASHSVFTQKFRAHGDRYPCLHEMPTFGHSENHAGVQIADLVCSALLFPMAVASYCAGILHSVHVKDYSVLAERYARRLDALQVRCADPARGDRVSGGITVDDKLTRRPRSKMFPALVLAVDTAASASF
jgi:hypothetical protein